MIYKIEHAFYGCETGCCGYELTNENYLRCEWTFDHIYQDSEILDNDLIKFTRKTWSKIIKENDTVIVGEWKDCKI
jgi:hypothetical protein